MRARLVLAAILAASVTLHARIARADDPSPAGRYALTDKVGNGAERSGIVTIAAADGGFDVHTAEKWPNGTGIAWDGSASLTSPRVLLIRRPIELTSRGFTDVVAGDADAGPDATALEYEATFDGGDLERADVKIFRIKLDGSRTQIGSGKLREKKPFWKKLPGDLIALAKKEVDKRLHDPEDLKKTFSLGDYIHVGVKASVQWIQDAQRTPFMKEADDAYRASGKGEPMWIRTRIEGGPRVDVGGSVPVGANLSLFAGIHGGASASYTVEDQSPKPTKISDVSTIVKLAEDVPADVYKLPFDASRAEELGVGSRRVVEANADVTIDGGASLGYRLADLGTLQGEVLTIDGSTTVRVYYGIRGTYRIEVERERDKLVRLRWTRLKARAWGGSFATTIGLTTSHTEYDVEAGSQWIHAVVDKGTGALHDYTLVQFGLGAEKAEEQQFVAELLFDLNDADARQCYDEAVHGNFIRAQQLGLAGKAAGIKFGRFTSSVTDRLSFSASFKAFKVLKADASSRTTTVHADVEDLDGRVTSTDSVLYERHSAGIFGGKRDLLAESVDRTVVRPESPTQTERGERVNFKFSRHDEHTSRGDVDAAIDLSQMLFGADAVAADKQKILASRPDDRRKRGGIFEAVFWPDHGREYGKSTLTILISLDDAAIERALSASPAEFYAAYGRACLEGYAPWNAARLDVLGHTSLAYDQKHATQAQEALRHEAWAYHDARAANKALDVARRAGAGTARADAFRKMAKVDGFEYRAVIAVASLGGESVHRELTLNSEGASLAYSAGTLAPFPGEDRLPLPPR